MAGVAVVFPGQGSQYVGMGKEFFDASSAVRELFDTAQAASGLDIARLCFEGPMDELTQTVNLQPSVIAVDLACWLAISDAGVEVAAVAGHSLGEYAALCAAGAFGPKRCLELVSLRGRLMDRDAAANPGAMAAVMGLSPDEVGDLCAQVQGQVQPANYNTEQQTVITGTKDAVDTARALVKERGKKAIPLRVSGAWHSPLMEAAGRDMARAIAEQEFAPLTCTMAPNTTGQPTSDPAQAQAELSKQITSSVKWVQSVQALLDMGIDTFIESGPKSILSGLIKKTAPPETRVFNVENPEGLASVIDATREP